MAPLNPRWSCHRVLNYSVEIAVPPNYPLASNRMQMTPYVEMPKASTFDIFKQQVKSMLALNVSAVLMDNTVIVVITSYTMLTT